MSKEELENHNELGQAEPMGRRGFFSGLFGRRRTEEQPQEDAPPVQSEQVYAPDEADYLGRLQLALSGAESLEDESAEAHLLDGATLLDSQRPFWAQLQDHAKKLFDALTTQLEREARESESAQAVEDAPSEAPALPDEAEEPLSSSEDDLLPEELESIRNASKPTPIDAQCEISVSEDKLTAWAFLLPPLFGGQEASKAMVHRTLSDMGISLGLDETQIGKLSDPPLYFKLLTVAFGTPPVNGIDGGILDLIPREVKPAYLENEDGTVNYKELNRLNHIQSGDVICEISAPTEPTPGIDVYGQPIPGTAGKPPIIPGGKNTQLNADGTRLLAATDGQVSFVNGKFQVDSVITISGNVDSSVGNLDVIGNVIVSGDVLEGFTLKASGNIQISGIVEGAKLIAGGNIQLNRGMNGNMHGTIRAKGDVVAQFLENCTVSARGNINVQSIINCTVSSDSSIDVTKGRGVIIGGVVTASVSLDAKIIGNASHRATEIIMGSTPEFRDKLSVLSKEVRVTEEELHELDLSIAYLEKNDLSAAPQKARLSKLKLRRSGVNIQCAKRTQQYNEMLQTFERMGNCYINSNIIYPGVRITIGLDSRPILETKHNCRLYCGDDGIVFGTK